MTKEIIILGYSTNLIGIICLLASAIGANILMYGPVDRIKTSLDLKRLKRLKELQGFHAHKIDKL
jgi:hypothetical protein